MSSSGRCLCLAWGRNPRPVPFPGRRREYILVGLDAASLPHTLPEKAPRPGLLSAVAPRSRSGSYFQKARCFRAKRVVAEIASQERMKQGCFIRAPMDGFTASPGQRYRTQLAPPSWRGATGKYLQRVLKKLTAPWSRKQSENPPVAKQTISSLPAGAPCRTPSQGAENPGGYKSG